MASSDKIKILYVDDEMNNLIGFKASFRFDYKVFTAINSSEAFEHLASNPDIRIIFCDQRMPEKTGVQFFEEVRTLYPNAIRILLTAYADVESVIDAINRGHIFRYVKKPWVDTDIRSAIGEADKFFMANSMISIKNDELQKAYNELDKFAYSVTHDVRAPLLSILGAINVGQYIDDMKEMKEMLVMMEESVKNLDTYIQNVHEYYNLKRGQLTIEEIDFRDIVNEQKETFRLTAKMKNVNFAADVKQQEPFRCDKMSLNIILNNLLSNAFKYQKKDNLEKMVDLDINVAAGAAVIRVKDNGIGIHESSVSEIFNLFYRATAENTGSGFGLYNVKDALIKLNGEISVDTLIGKGSTFKVVIPNK